MHWGRDFHQRARQVHIVALVFRRSFESRPRPWLGIHLRAESPALSTLSGESSLRHQGFGSLTPASTSTPSRHGKSTELPHSGPAGVKAHVSATAYLRACASSLSARRPQTANSFILPSVRLLLESFLQILPTISTISIPGGWKAVLGWWIRVHVRAR